MAVSRRPPRSRLVLLAAVVLTAVALLLATDFDLGLLMVMPSLLIAGVFLAWPYPGLELILRIANRHRHPRAAKAAGRRRRRLDAIVRGARLLAASLGGRAPPPLLSCP